MAGLAWPGCLDDAGIRLHFGSRRLRGQDSSRGQGHTWETLKTQNITRDPNKKYGNGTRWRGRSRSVDFCRCLGEQGSKRLGTLHIIQRNSSLNQMPLRASEIYQSFDCRYSVSLMWNQRRWKDVIVLKIKKTFCANHITTAAATVRSRWVRYTRLIIRARKHTKVRNNGHVCLLKRRKLGDQSKHSKIARKYNIYNFIHIKNGKKIGQRNA